MKTRIMTCLSTVALTLAGSHAAAATLDSHPATGAISRTGTFAGARIRLSLGGRAAADRDRLRVGLTLAPVRQSVSTSGRQLSLYGEGVELGFSGSKPLAFSIAGTPLSRIPDQRRQGVSTIGKVAIGVGVAVVVTIGVLYAVTQEALNDPQD